MDFFQIFLDKGAVPLMLAITAAVFGGLGYAVREQNEHRRWLTQERYEAFLDTLKRTEERSAIHQEWRALSKQQKRLDSATLADPREVSQVEEDLKELRVRLLGLKTEVSEASVKLRLLGSDGTASAAEALAEAYADTPPDRDAIRRAEQDFLGHARKHLRVEGAGWWSRIRRYRPQRSS